MSKEVFTDSEGGPSGNITFFPTAMNLIFPSNNYPSEFYIVVTITSIVFSVISIAIVYLITKSLVNVCCSLPNSNHENEVYIRIPCNDETLTAPDGNYDAQQQNSHAVNIHSNPVLYDDSDFDNLSLNPALNDTDYFEKPPEYEPPPPYPSPRPVKMFSKLS